VDVGKQIPDDATFAELILYISRLSEGDHRFGATKLNKLLFYADFLAYVRFGRSITAHEYQKLEHGPAPRRLMPIRNELIQKMELALRVTDQYGRQQNRTFALREPDLSRFRPEEIDLICELVDEHWDKKATQMSDESHGLLMWQLAVEGETIPYEAALVAGPPQHISAPVKRRAQRLERKAKRLLRGSA
jgi:hypothetical protein